ncbi:MAG: cell division protein ZapA [Lachnospiraceae bacterium]|nr:cell division protein ZapA [Lachnospiraceae bacterium]MBO4762283.1 cell division protein ZapA [Lachnospiraceae bacterium]MBQ6092017.1 cell division protein ZapA [Lachnospiraceae bacterium]MBR5368975.1 cell division protein ZapA [Lachnospiraceae bacterium]
MNKRNDTQVMILNKQYTLSGFESDEYLQRIAYLINSMYDEVKKMDVYKSMDLETKHILLCINLADEYCKIKNRNDELKNDIDRHADEIGALRREIIDLKSKLDLAAKEREQLKEKIVEEQKKIVKLETELTAEKKNRR